MTGHVTNRVPFYYLCLACAWGSSGWSLVYGAATPPYAAVVQAPPGEEAYVRSGPGKKYYPTLKLENGARVTVRRHDAGGWYMIDPPAESFSWILAKYVQRTGPNSGTVTENYVVVRLGSFQSDIRDVEQQRLNRGDAVEILEEKALDGDRGLENWYKIRSPRGEKRWMQGQHLIPLNPDGSPQSPTTLATGPRTEVAAVTPQPKPGPTKPRVATGPDGGDAPIFSAQEHAPAEDPFGIGAGIAKSTAPAPTVASEPPAATANRLTDLQTLDDELQQMLQLPAVEWDIAGMREEYQMLQESLDDPVLKRQAGYRIKSLDHYEQIHENAAELAQITAATTQRELELQAIQRAAEQRAGLPPRAEQGPLPPPVAPDPRTGEPVAATPPPQQQSAFRTSRFDGAGVIRRMSTPQPGLPRYVLTTPDGRLLAYLVPESGINLDQYVGQAMGLIGPRGFDSRLGSDVLRVRQMSPVRLTSR